MDTKELLECLLTRMEALEKMLERLHHRVTLLGTANSEGYEMVKKVLQTLAENNEELTNDLSEYRGTIDDPLW